MQLSVARYGAIGVGRGANLDLIDRPITNLPWIRAHLANPAEIVNWTNPGPGGFYDDLGDPANRPHLVFGQGFEKDPAFFHTARTGFASRRNQVWRINWHRHAESLYGNTLKLEYTGLDLAAQYKVRFIQAGDATPRATRLTANGTTELHPMRKKEIEVKPQEFDIPASVTAGGTLTLEWTPDPAEAGNGRFVQISEVWLIRKVNSPK